MMNSITIDDVIVVVFDDIVNDTLLSTSMMRRYNMKCDDDDVDMLLRRFVTAFDRFCDERAPPFDDLSSRSSSGVMCLCEAVIMGRRKDVSVVAIFDMTQYSIFLIILCGDVKYNTSFAE